MGSPLSRGRPVRGLAILGACSSSTSAPTSRIRVFTTMSTPSWRALAPPASRRWSSPGPPCSRAGWRRRSPIATTSTAPPASIRITHATATSARSPSSATFAFIRAASQSVNAASTSIATIRRIRTRRNGSWRSSSSDSSSASRSSCTRATRIRASRRSCARIASSKPWRIASPARRRSCTPISSWGSISASPAGSAMSAAASTCSRWYAISRATGCYSRPIRRTSRRAICVRSRRHGGTSRPFCRISSKPWHGRSAVRRKSSPSRPRATPSAYSASVMNLAHLLVRNAQLQPDAPAIAQGKHAVRSYGELAGRVARLAAGLRRKLNLEPGDRVALAIKNCVEYHEVLFACWHAGLVAVPMNAKLHPKEFAYILENSGAKACFVTPELESATPSGTAVGEIDELRGEPMPPAEVKPEDGAWLFYTSGTTGVPKGAVLTHRNLMFQTQAYFTDIDQLAANFSILHPAPLSHGSGCYALPHFAAGALNVIPESGHFEPDEIFGLLERWTNVSFFAAPTMLCRLLASAAARPPRNLKTIV